MSDDKLYDADYAFERQRRYQQARGVMQCTRCGSSDAEPRREHAERVLCDACAARAPVIDWEHPPDAPDAELVIPTDYTPNGNAPPASWLEGVPCDPFAEPPEPLPAVPGIPFTYRPASVLITAPTGAGKSCLLQAALYDLATSYATTGYALRGAYLSGEVSQGGFNARARDLADRRGDDLGDDNLLEQLALLRWLDLPAVIGQAWEEPWTWADDLSRLYNVIAIDPVSSVASALGLDFDRNNDDYVRFHDRLIKPLTDRGMVVLLVDNIGHAIEAKGRAKGVSSKMDKADVILACSLRAGPALALKVTKARSVRAPFKRGDVWTFDRAAQRIVAADDVERDGDPDTFRPTQIMQRVSRALEAEPGLTRNGVRAAVKGKGTYVDLALELLTAEGYVDAKRDGQANRHTSRKPYRFPESQPFPNRVPGNGEVTVSPSPAVKDSGNGKRSEDPANRVPDPFEPNGNATCPDCGARLTPIGTTGRLTCIGCTSKEAA